MLLKQKFKGKFIFASSAAVYGDVSGLKCVDGYAYGAYQPINPYGHSKAQTEQQLNDIGIANEFDFLSMRFFNVVGAYKGLGQQLSYPHILTSLCRAVYENEPFSIYGYNYDTIDGSCVRDYIHVEDVVDALILAAEHNKADLWENYFNVCREIPISNIQLVKEFSKYTGKSVDLHFKERRPGDPGFLVGEKLAMKTQFGFEAKHDLESIITSAWEYYKKAVNV